MATDSRVRAWSDGALQWVIEKFHSALSFTRAYSDPALAVSPEIRRVIEQYFANVTNREFLDDLADTVKKQTRTQFSKGVQSEDLEGDHAADKAIEERSVSLTGHGALEARWKRVILACDCQTLPNHTISSALLALGLKRVQDDHILQRVHRETSYTVHLERAEAHVRITLIFEVTLSCDWRSEELLIHLVFVVREDGTVVRIEKTTVDKVENIALGALE